MGDRTPGQAAYEKHVQLFGHPVAETEAGRAEPRADQGGRAQDRGAATTVPDPLAAPCSRTATAELPERGHSYKTALHPDHPLAMKDGYVYVHRLVLYGTIGPGTHACHWCGREVEWNARGMRNLLADHLDGDIRNNSPDNLVPSCRSCNGGRAKNPDFLTHCGKGHEFTPENTYRPPGRPQRRQCRTCAKDRSASRVYRPKGNKGRAIGSRHPQSKLAEDTVREIRQRYSTGMSRSALAQTYGVSKSAIQKVVTGTHWRHVA